MAKLRVLQNGSAQPARQAETRQLRALLAAAQILEEMSRHVLGQISPEGPQAELYDHLVVAVAEREAGTPAAIASLAADLIHQATH